MPIFVDRHDAPGLSPEELAALHTRDLEVQARHQVRYHTYWFDPADGTIFCLAEGPNREAVEQVHREAHGQVAGVLIEVDLSTPLNAFFGALPLYPAGTAYSVPAMRAIVFTDVCGSVAQTQQLGDDGHMLLLSEHNEIVRTELTTCDGREVKHTGDGIMAAFNSVAAAVTFSIAVQRRLHERNSDASTPLHVSIGISAGEPVTDESDDLFGAAVQLAARLCGAAAAGHIVTSIAVRELCIGKPFRFDELEQLSLRGFPEPMSAYAVVWRE